MKSFIRSGYKMAEGQKNTITEGQKHRANLVQPPPTLHFQCELLSLNDVLTDQAKQTRRCFFHPQKMMISFLFLHKNMFWVLIKAPQHGASNEYQQLMLSWRNKKNIMWISPSYLEQILSFKVASPPPLPKPAPSPFPPTMPHPTPTISPTPVLW